MVKSSFPQELSYISSKKVKTFLKDPTKPQSLMMVFKLALKQFYRVNFQMVLLNSPKIKKKSRLDQMMKSRELLETLFKN